MSPDPMTVPALWWDPLFFCRNSREAEALLSLDYHDAVDAGCGGVLYFVPGLSWLTAHCSNNNKSC